MDLLETDDQLTIVNRAMQHRISKKLIRKVPYFEKMLSHDLLEAEENKVELDFDEKAFKWFLIWIEFDYIFIEMDFVIDMYNLFDYFGISDCLMDDFVKYFHANFSIEHLPVIIRQVTPTSKLINSGALNAFICRYFLKIVNSPIWLKFPIQSIDYICGLDLMVPSEIQVFNAIIRWADFKADSRKGCFKGLLKLVRWCNLEEKDFPKIKENEFMRSSDFEPELWYCNKPECYCSVDRTKQGCFVVVEELNKSDLQVQLLDRNFLPLINHTVIQSDESMPLLVIHDEHVSDISFDSGRQMIRIDWKQNKYRLLDCPAYKSHCPKMIRCIFEEQESASCSVMTPNQEYRGPNQNYESSLLESNEKLILVRNELYSFRFWKNPYITDINSEFECNGHTYLATVLDKSIYMLTDKLEFFEFDIDRKFAFKKIKLPRFEDKLKFNNLLLTSKQADDDRVIFIDKTTKDIFCFNVTTQEWKSIDQIIDCKSNSSEDSKEPNVLKTFTFGLISLDTINLCSKHKLTQ
ncbi:uncharacterized protein LOC107371887 [Tetranychus urticae]|uniref:BACK domain-containing protein n=1 Tax=Tetranychus urticae TaxID=32264 RepID=T1JXL9_TETUR|nr:uncharacterized protein LOC107371887 [Tetranychus urticae]XP_025018582.1 uncharacterized protein LOC107371887 [Tetranychus urticae]XP_025018583.1 uncharacterized protein LOC107371887 [Tetranychus urticae]